MEKDGKEKWATLFPRIKGFVLRLKAIHESGFDVVLEIVIGPEQIGLVLIRCIMGVTVQPADVTGDVLDRDERVLTEQVILLVLSGCFLLEVVVGIGIPNVEDISHIIDVEMLLGVLDEVVQLLELD